MEKERTTSSVAVDAVAPEPTSHSVHEKHQSTSGVDQSDHSTLATKTAMPATLDIKEFM